MDDDKKYQNSFAEGVMQVYSKPLKLTARDYEFLDGLNKITGDENVTSVFLLGLVQMLINETKEN